MRFYSELSGSESSVSEYIISSIIIPSLYIIDILSVDNSNSILLYFLLTFSVYLYGGYHAVLNSYSNLLSLSSHGNVITS